MSSGPFRRHRARPVGDAPIDPLLANAEELAKAWLLALIERVPLEDASRILATDLAREGPRVLDAVIRAVGADADQRRLEPGGALVPLVGRVGELAGALNAEAVSQAVDALQSVVWAALRAELRDPPPELVSELAERLTQVAGLVRAAALRHATESGPRTEPAAVPRGSGASTWARAAARPPDLGFTASPPEPGYTASPPGPGYTASSPAPGYDAPSPLDPAASMVTSVPVSPLPQAWLENEGLGAETDALWVRALEEEIDRAGDASLSLLLAELEDADRIRAVEDDQAYTETLSEFNQAVRQAVRRQDLLVCDTPARAWIIARDTGRGGARALAQRITAGVSRSKPWRGAALVASIGIAVLGEDGMTPGQLIEAAEEARFAAGASGHPA
jgi:GGDEF domain-containing protein